MKYSPVIGLEIHSELKTRSKMFCSCLNDPLESRPNFNICPICLGHPGTLPTVNKKAVEQLIKTGLALKCRIANYSKFDRKNYFYPDLPKGYQISQYDLPFCERGYLDLPFKAGGKKIKIRRIHLEEDTGRLIHSTGSHHSLVDFNRAGVPLMELVTEPDLNSAEETRIFAEELQLILRHLGVSDADMEKGQLRVEANVSLGTTEELAKNKLGTKVEIKNLNSFKATEKAINYEINRQTKILQSGKKILQETRGWNENNGITISQREKEEAHDYRYLAEPDLPLFDLTDKNFIDLEEIQLSIPELPQAKRQRLISEFALSLFDADLLVADPLMADYFEKTVSEFLADYSDLSKTKKYSNIQLIFNYLTSDLRGFLNKTGLDFNYLKITTENFADLIALVIENKISSRTAKDLIPLMQETSLDPQEIIKEKNLIQVSNKEEISEIIEKVINSNQSAVKDYQKGKTGALQFLIGRAMALLDGRGNPEVIKSMFKKKINKD